MAKERGRSETPDQRNGETRASNKQDTKGKEKKKNKDIDELENDFGSEDISQRSKDRHRSRSRSRSKKRSRSSKSSDDYSDSDRSYSDSESGSSESSFSESESEDERRRRKRKERKKREERHREKERRREKEKRKERDEKKKKKKRSKDKKSDKSKKGMGAVTDSWGKYGIIKEVDMWNKRPEFTAWLLEIKKVNLESLSNWEEKKMFTDFMEDYNTGTFRSKKYYNLDAYHQKKIEKEIKKGYTSIPETEMTVFNDEEQLRRERLKEREIYKEQQIEALKYSMQGGMAKAMKEQAQLREEMAYQYKLGNFEAAAAIQRRLEPDPPM
ncbi:protein FAM133B [Impatiens glandulifera]|uniref:protein FAM133B n=1 Tax=Impatiens glandulifera TaxID=253017 RepID=UPI001FB05941|nr:protein FAM133B [Impatiens glandulifera]